MFLDRDCDDLVHKLRSWRKPSSLSKSLQRRGIFVAPRRLRPECAAKCVPGWSGSPLHTNDYGIAMSRTVQKLHSKGGRCPA